jgi:hypothetical protein
VAVPTDRAEAPAAEAPTTVPRRTTPSPEDEAGLPPQAASTKAATVKIEAKTRRAWRMKDLL